MKRSITFKYNLTSHNKIQKTIQETYMRTFLPCGFICCTSDGYLTSTTDHYVIPTFAVLTEYLPLFQSKHVKAIILHSTLRDIARENSIEYKKIMESIMHQFIFYNDFYDATNADIDIISKEETLCGESDLNSQIPNISKSGFKDEGKAISKEPGLNNKIASSSRDKYEDREEAVFKESGLYKESVLNSKTSNISRAEPIDKEKDLSEKQESNSQKNGLNRSESSLMKSEFKDEEEYLKFTKVLDFYHSHIPTTEINILTSNNIHSYPHKSSNPTLITDLLTKVISEKTTYTEYYTKATLNSMELSNLLYRGILYTNYTNCNTGFLHTNYKGQNIRIKILNKSSLNRAINMDGVYVEIVEEVNDEVIGKVVGLYRRDYLNIVGTIDCGSINGTGPQYVLVIPVNRKYPKVRISTSRVDELEGKRIVVKINEWNVNSNYPFGSYVGVLGDLGDRKCEIESILMTNGIDYENYVEGYGICSVIQTLEEKIRSHTNTNNIKDTNVSKVIDNNIKNDNNSNDNELFEDGSKRIRRDFFEDKNLNISIDSELQNSEKTFEDISEIYKTVVELEKNVRVSFVDCEVISIDPPGCTDIDDAMHCREINGLTEVGIHIADVSFFVDKNSLLDKEALKRGSTVYLTEIRLEMLPSFLSSWFCSLVENEDRLTFSVLLYFDSNYKLVNRKFQKGIIRSKKSFTYEEAQNELNNGCKEYKGLYKLNEIAKHLKMKRTEAGALELSSTELKIYTNKDQVMFGNIEKIEQKALFETSSLVEEFMLIANIEVSNMIYSRNKDSSLLRRHPKFADDSFDELKVYLSKQNIDLNYLTSKQLNDSIKNIQDEEFKKILKKIITRSMNQATYFSSGTYAYNDFLHYGLSVPIYTHFTSPIRRYADLIVHRQLYESFNNVNSYTCDYISNVCKQINMRNKNAMRASFDCDRFYIYLYVKTQKCLKLKAFISKTSSNFIILYIPELQIEESLKSDDEYKQNSCEYYRDGKRLYGLYDWLMVSIRENDDMFYLKRSFDMQII